MFQLILISSTLGTEALERLVKKILVALRLDKDGDGKVSRAEVFAAIAELAPEFFNISAVTEEVRDLDVAEFNHLCNVAADNMPDFPNVRAEAETLISAVLEAIGAAAKVVHAVNRLNATRPEKAPEPTPAPNPPSEAPKATPAPTPPSTATPPIVPSGPKLDPKKDKMDGK